MARFFIFISLLLATVSSALVTHPVPELESRDLTALVACVVWCKLHYAHPGYVCIAPAAHHTGPCYECGPSSSNPAKKFCSGACVDTGSDPNNCGSCGNACPTTCTNGVCDPVPTCVEYNAECVVGGLPCCVRSGREIQCQTVNEGDTVGECFA
ncbi:hypothetical protein V8F06_014780 [Rhypophila decipiens]